MRECAIVSTFSTRNVRDLGFGSSPATARTAWPEPRPSPTPALPAPIYFNEDVIPDPAQPLSSVDGGVIWTGVPTGVYRLRARHPSTRFASFVATCRPGRVVNANPPWGFHELGQAMPATVSARWTGCAGGLRLGRLRVTKLPPGRDACESAAPAAAAPSSGGRSRSRAGGASTLLDALGPAPRFLRAGQRIDVLVTAHAYDGKLVRWRSRTARWAAVVHALRAAREHQAAGAAERDGR